MATFFLNQGLNSVNNPSADGVFEYGFINRNDPAFPIGYVKFDSYGYTDGTTTPPGPPYDQNKILGWYKSGSPDRHVAIAYEHLGDPTLATNILSGYTYKISSIGTTDFTLIGAPNNNIGTLFVASGAGVGNGIADKIHYQITPQPFPANGIYIHPGKSSGSTVGTKDPVIRINIPFSGNISINGTIQRATEGCGSDIGYTILKNQSAPILPRQVLPTNSLPTNINISSYAVNAGEYIDIMIDSGDDGNDQCDDTAITLSVTFDASQIATPILIGTPNCNSTSLQYSIQLQQEGNVDLFRVGNVNPIANQNISASGINGVVTFSGLDLTNGGSYYAVAKNSGQLDSEQSTLLVIEPCVAQVCNEQITFYKVKNNCTSGTPTAVQHTILAGTHCAPGSTVEAQNWIAYLAAQAQAQTNANINGQCIECSAANPCVMEYEVGRVLVKGTPGAIVKVYKGDLVIIEMPINASGIIEIKHEFLIGDIFLTLTGGDNIESEKQCMPISLKDRLSKNCEEKPPCSKC